MVIGQKARGFGRRRDPADQIKMQPTEEGGVVRGWGRTDMAFLPTEFNEVIDDLRGRQGGGWDPDRGDRPGGRRRGIGGRRDRNGGQLGDPSLEDVHLFPRELALGGHMGIRAGSQKLDQVAGIGPAGQDCGAVFAPAEYGLERAEIEAGLGFGGIMTFAAPFPQQGFDMRGPERIVRRPHPG